MIIALSIPLSILFRTLSALGETINIMTLGGLALAVGILVDDATVDIENINRNLAQGKRPFRPFSTARSRLQCRHLSRRCASALCSCRCFFSRAWRNILFVPLAEAVVFAMLASYVLSRTLVPTLAMYLLCAWAYHSEEHATGKDIFSRFQRGFAHGLIGCATAIGMRCNFALDHAWTFCFSLPGVFASSRPRLSLI